MKRQLVNVAVEKSHEALAPGVGQTNAIKDTGNRAPNHLTHIDLELEDPCESGIVSRPGEGDGLPSLLSRLREVAIRVLAEGVEGVEKSSLEREHFDDTYG